MATVGPRAPWRVLAVLAVLTALLGLPVATASAGIDNVPPTAVNAEVRTTPGTPVTIDTATLVTDPDGDAWVVFSVEPGKYGTVSFEGRRVTYSPEKGYVGPDAFAYTVDDGRGGSATATIYVTVDPDAPPPTGDKPQAIAFDGASDLKVGDTASLVAKADSGLPVTFTTSTPRICSVRGNQVTGLSAGTCGITASQGGDETWAPADPVTRAIWVGDPGNPGRSPQVVDFAQPDPVLAGDGITLVARASSGLDVVVTSETPKICTVEGAVVRTYAAGTCVLTATQEGDATWAPADPVTRSVRVGDPGSPDRSPQVIEFAPPDAVTTGYSFSVIPKATSGLDVVLTSETPKICVVEGFTVTTYAAGSCWLTATQPGDATWAPATPVTREVKVDPLVVPPDPSPQGIDFAQPGPVTAGDSFTVAPRATSGLDVLVTSETPEVCTVEGLTVTALAAGTCVLTATQPGNGAWAPADPVTREVTVDPVAPPPPDRSPQTIAFHPADAVLGLTPGYELEATASSGLPVTLEVTLSACALDGTTLTAPAAGACTVTATQSGSDAYQPAEPVTAVVKLVLPQDDAAGTPGATAVLVDVLRNDPSDVTLDEVSAPGHGEAAVVDGQVRYLPDPAFRGTDTFTYTVSLDGRSAWASVSVAVDNQAPRLKGTHLEQLAGTEETVLLDPQDPNGDQVDLQAVSGASRVSAPVSDHALTVVAADSASGDVAITVTATDSEGASAEALVTTRITPLAPTHVRRTLSDRGTTVRWRPAPTAGAVYETLLDGETVCRSARPVCSSHQLVGPLRHVTVRTLGRDGTRSARVDAPLVGHGRILLATVYFRTGSARLTDAGQHVLALAVRAIQLDGFGRVRLDGYTDTDGGWAFNRALSRRRTHAVALFLHDYGSIATSRAWHGETDPAAPNNSSGGRSRNRRVEVVLRY